VRVRLKLCTETVVVPERRSGASGFKFRSFVGIQLRVKVVAVVMPREQRSEADSLETAKWYRRLPPIYEYQAAGSLRGILEE
jgi:hypothetical protein